MHEIEPLLLSTTRISTFDGERVLTAGTGFFFQREDRLYLVTSRHVLHDPGPGHVPDRISFAVHTSADDLRRTATCSLMLYVQGKSQWVEASDSGGRIDVAAIQLPAGTLPPDAIVHAFTPDHIEVDHDAVRVGCPILLVGFPLGFYDVTHQLPIVRRGSIASAFGVRFQGQGFFLTDARMHRGASGAPVLLQRSDGGGGLDWTLLGVHSARMDMATRDTVQDDLLGLNCAWYADILDTLTRPPKPAEARGGNNAPRPAESGTGSQARTPSR
jgi:hypothetical protein